MIEPPTAPPWFERKRPTVTFIIAIATTVVAAIGAATLLIHLLIDDYARHRLAWSDAPGVAMAIPGLALLTIILVMPIWVFALLGSEMKFLRARQPAVWAAELVCSALVLWLAYEILTDSSSTAALGFIVIPVVEAVAGAIVLTIGVGIDLAVQYERRRTRSGSDK